MIHQGILWAPIFAIHAQEYGVFGGMVAGALVLGATPFGRPLKWAETFYHEMSHGLICMLTLGRVARLDLKFDGSGTCWTRGGSRILTLLAGYMGSAAWGGVLYLIGWHLAYSDGASMAKLWLELELGAMGLVVILWVRHIQTLIIMLILGGLYAGALMLPNIGFLPYILQFLGIYVLLNAIRAPLYLFDGRHVGDGAALADIFKVLPEFVWVLWWFVFALGVLVLCAVKTLPGADILLHL